LQHRELRAVRAGPDADADGPVQAELEHLREPRPVPTLSDRDRPDSDKPVQADEPDRPDESRFVRAVRPGANADPDPTVSAELEHADQSQPVPALRGRREPDGAEALSADELDRPDEHGVVPRLRPRPGADAGQAVQAVG